MQRPSALVDLLHLTVQVPDGRARTKVPSRTRQDTEVKPGDEEGLLGSPFVHHPVLVYDHGRYLG